MPETRTTAPADARLLDLAQGVLALVWDAMGPPGRLRPHLAELGLIGHEIAGHEHEGLAVSRRHARVVLPLIAGGNRVLLLFRPEGQDHPDLGAGALDPAGTEIAVAPRFRMRGDARTLLAGVTASGHARLLRFLIGLGTSAFAVASDPRWLAMIHTILDETGGERPELVVRCRLAEDLVLVEATGSSPIRAGDDLAVVDHEVLRRSTVLDRVDRDGVAAFAVRMPEGAAEVDAVVALPLGDGIQLMTLRRGQGIARSASAWIVAGDSQRGAARRRALELIGRLAGGLPTAGDLLRELRLADATEAAPPASVTVELALPTRAGILIAGRIVDPRRQVSHLRVERAGGTRRVGFERLLRPGRLGSDRFLVLVDQPEGIPPALPCWIVLALHSGATQDLGEAPWPSDCATTRIVMGDLAQAFAGQPGPAREALLEALRGLPVARASLDSLPIGPTVADPAITLVLPLDLDPGIVRCRIGMLAGEAGASRMELLHLADDGVPTGAARALLEGLRAVHGLSGTLLSTPSGISPGAAIDAALAVARGRTVIRLGEGVLPAGRGWIARLARFLDRRPEGSLAGLPILASDDTVVHAGGEMVLDEGHARLWRHAQGLPQGMAPTSTRRTPVVPDGCLALRRADLPRLTEELGRFHTIDGAMTALSLRASMLAEAWTLAPPGMVRVTAQGERSLGEALLRQTDLDLAMSLGRAAIRPSRPVPTARLPRPSTPALEHRAA